MTKSEIFRAAHEVAKRDRRLYPSYRAALSEAIAAVHATIRYDARMDALYGVGMRPGFQIIEPSYKRRQYKPLTGQWVTL